MSFRFYISDPHWGGITGTDDLQIAKAYADSEDYFVVDTEQGVQLAPQSNQVSLVPEARDLRG